MQKLQLTTLLIDRDPSWRPTISTACQIVGRKYSEDLLYKVTYEMSENIVLDENTLEVDISVTDEAVLSAIENYSDAATLPPSEIEQRLNYIENQLEELDFRERIVSLEQTASRLETQVSGLEQVGQLEPPVLEGPELGDLQPVKGSQ